MRINLTKKDLVNSVFMQIAIQRKYRNFIRRYFNQIIENVIKYIKSK